MEKDTDGVITKTVRFNHQDVAEVKKLCRDLDLDFSKFVRRAVRRAVLNNQTKKG